MSDSADVIRDRSRERDRSRRGDKPSRFSDGGGGGGRDRSRDRGDRKFEKRNSNRHVYVSNICYEYRWQDLKDLFRTHVGDVAHVELFVDENEKPRGCGIVEFTDEKAVKKCLQVMHRFDLKGRKLVVREDSGNERDRYGNIINSRRSDREILPDLRDEIRLDRGGSSNLPSLMSGVVNTGDLADKWGNTYGLSPQFLEELDIRGPLLHRIFVANLDYKVDEKKLTEVFKLAGKVLSVELSRDKDGNSRGFAVVEYDHPVESVQAISMLNGQQLYDRKLIVRMDRDRNEGPPKLPDGLKSVGLGLGPNGDPLRDVSRNLPSNSSSLGGGPTDNLNPNSSLLNSVPGLHSLGSSALSNVVGGNSGLAGLASSQAAALQASLASVGGLSNPNLTMNLGNLGNEIALANLSNSGLNAASLVSNSLQNTSLASLAHNLGSQSGLGSLGAGNTGGSNYSRHDSGSYNSGNTGSNAGRYATSPSVQDRGRGDYMESRGDYDLPNGIGGSLGSRRSYNQDMKSDNDYKDFRSGSIYSTVNNGSQGRGSMSGGGGGGSGSVQPQIGSQFSRGIILPPSATWNMLKDKFRQFGEITYCEMKGNDVGVIQFADVRHAKEAVEMMDRARVEGRTIDVRFF